MDFFYIRLGLLDCWPQYPYGPVLEEHDDRVQQPI